MSPLRVYCVEKVERQYFREVSDVRPLQGRSIAQILISRSWRDFCSLVNEVEFFNTTDPLRTLQKRPAVLSETTSSSDKVPLTAELPAEEAEDWTVAFGQAQ